jgi:hypothetical protein
MMLLRQSRNKELFPYFATSNGGIFVAWRCILID